MFKDTQKAAEAFQFRSTVVTKGNRTFRLKEFDTDSYSLEVFRQEDLDLDSRIFWEEFTSIKEVNKATKKFTK